MTDASDPVDWTGQERVSLALQGGDSHGAFTSGVLDYLLADATLDSEAITGTSAGAMNAVVLAEGYLEGSRNGARKSLAKFWRSISDAAAFSPVQRKFLKLFFSSPSQSMATQWWTDFLAHYASPYEFNPLNINPLRGRLEKAVDFTSTNSPSIPTKETGSATGAEAIGVAVVVVLFLGFLGFMAFKGLLSREAM